MYPFLAPRISRWRISDTKKKKLQAAFFVTSTAKRNDLSSKEKRHWQGWLGVWGAEVKGKSKHHQPVSSRAASSTKYLGRVCRISAVESAER